MIRALKILGLGMLLFVMGTLAGWLAINAVLTPGNQLLQAAFGGGVLGFLGGMAAITMLED